MNSFDDLDQGEVERVLGDHTYLSLAKVYMVNGDGYFALLSNEKDDRITAFVVVPIGSVSGAFYHNTSPVVSFYKYSIMGITPLCGSGESSYLDFLIGHLDELKIPGVGKDFIEALIERRAECELRDKKEEKPLYLKH